MTLRDDVAFLHGLTLDERANELAAARPRERGEFRARWTEILAEVDGGVTTVTPRILRAVGVSTR